MIHSWTVDLDNWTVHNYSLGAVRIWNQTQVPGISAPVLIRVLSKSTRYRRRAQFDFTGHLWLHSRKKTSHYWHQRIGPVHPPCKSQGKSFKNNIFRTCVLCKKKKKLGTFNSYTPPPKKIAFYTFFFLHFNIFFSWNACPASQQITCKIFF